MKTLIVLLAVMVLAGCATSPTYIYPGQSRTVVHTTHVVRTAPVAVGVYTSGVIFGGTVSYLPHPIYYIHEGINYDSRYIYNYSRRYVRDNARPRYPFHPPHPREKRRQR